MPSKIPRDVTCKGSDEPGGVASSIYNTVECNSEVCTSLFIVFFKAVLVNVNGIGIPKCYFSCTT